MIVTVDGRRTDAPDGTTVLDAVNRLGIALPQLCKDPDRAPLGACRTCLVHVDGMAARRTLPPATRAARLVETQHPDPVRVRSMCSISRARCSDGRWPHGFGQVGAAIARRPRSASWGATHAYDTDATKSFSCWTATPASSAAAARWPATTTSRSARSRCWGGAMR